MAKSIYNNGDGTMLLRTPLYNIRSYLLICFSWHFRLPGAAERRAQMLAQLHGVRYGT